MDTFSKEYVVEMITLFYSLVTVFHFIPGWREDSWILISVSVFDLSSYHMSCSCWEAHCRLVREGEERRQCLPRLIKIALTCQISWKGLRETLQASRWHLENYCCQGKVLLFFPRWQGRRVVGRNIRRTLLIPRMCQWDLERGRK